MTDTVDRTESTGSGGPVSIPSSSSANGVIRRHRDQGRGHDVLGDGLHHLRQPRDSRRGRDSTPRPWPPAPPWSPACSAS